MSSGPKKSFAQFPPDFRLPGLGKRETGKQAGKKPGVTPAAEATSTYYRQGVLVPGGVPARPVSRNRTR